MQVGHTHNELDQLFSGVSGVLASAPALEDPYEFKSWMVENVKPQRGRKLVVEVLGGTWDFQKWLNPLNLQISGLASTHKNPSVNHVWRIVPRRFLTGAGLTNDAIQIETFHADWLGLEKDDEDAILMVKQYMHSSDFSQQPLLLLPAAVAKRLDRAALKDNGRLKSIHFSSNPKNGEGEPKKS